MALEFLENPRKAPRIRARCEASVVAGGVRFEGHTEDVGPHGCALVAPQPVARGAGIAVVLRAPEASESLQATGTVAWASPHAPFRLGVAFAEASRPAATRFFNLVAAARPGLAAWRRVPDRISYDAMIWLAPPPRLVVDFTADEVSVLRAVGTGATVFELKSRLRGRWQEAQRALFSLLTGNHVTLSRGGAVPFANWSSLLHELEAELAAASLGETTSSRPIARPTVAPPPRPADGSPAAAPSGRYAAAQKPVDFADGASGLDMDPSTLELDLTPRRPQAGSGWANRPSPRSREAEEAWQQALLELAAGRSITAVALLRRALALAPGDPEVARKLGEVTSSRG
jgi:PilZ domain